jgi:predicted transcriptional regulator
MNKRNWPPVKTQMPDGSVIPGDHVERLKRTEEKARRVLWCWSAIRVASGKPKVSSTAIVDALSTEFNVAVSPRTVRFHITWLMSNGLLEPITAGNRPTLRITRKGRAFIRELSLT